MKKILLLIVVLFSLLGTGGCLNINETNKLEADKLTPVPSKVATKDKQKENLNTDIDYGTQIEPINKTDNDIKGISSFIPSGWQILESRYGKSAIAEGDLNNDGIIDKAFIIEESTQLDSPKNLLIVFGNKDNTFTLSIKAEKAVLYAYEGGGFGEPFDEIIVDRGSILLKFYGGSLPRWYKNYRFRYQNNGWYLIGATEGYDIPIDDNSLDNLGYLDIIEEDYNLLTGDYIFKKRVEGKIKTIKGNRGKRQLLNLQDFDVHFESKSQF